VRAVRCFVTRAVTAPRAVRAVRAVYAVRCFVTPVKKLRKSVNICQSYRKNKSVSFLWTTVYNNFMALNSLLCADVLLRNCSFTHLPHCSRNLFRLRYVYPVAADTVTGWMRVLQRELAVGRVYVSVCLCVCV